MKNSSSLSLSQITLITCFIISVLSILYYYKDFIYSFLIDEYFNVILTSSFFIQIKLSFYENKLIIYSTILFTIISTITTIIYDALNGIWGYIKSKFLMQISLNSTEEMYKWLLSYIGKNAKDFMLTTPKFKLQKIKNLDPNNSWRRYENVENNNEIENYEFVPSAGNYVLRWKGQYIYMMISNVGESISAGMDKESYQLETLDLYAYGGKNTQKIMYQLLQEAIKSQITKYREKIKIFTMGRWTSWEPMAREKRPLSSIILSDNTLDEILSDVRNFLSKGEWYKKLGVPFKRGYLFYGVHGSGKTSLITAIASEIDYSVCVLSLSGNNMNDTELNHRIHSAPPRSIILLEDIDAIFVDRDAPKANDERGNNVTFSGFLNALDGAAAATDGRLYFMTTNHIEKLDSALLRAGRCDVKIAFKHANRDQIKRCYKRFFPIATDKQMDDFAKEFPEHSVTVAEIQSHLLINKNNPEKAIDDARAFYESIVNNRSNANKSKLTLDELLKRLSLNHYSKKFKEARIFHPNDLNYISNNELKSLGFTLGESTRLTNYWIDNDTRAVAEFALATKVQIEKFYQEFCGDLVTNIQAKELSNLIPNNSISITQLRVYLSKILYNISSPFSHELVLNQINDLLYPPNDTIIETKQIDSVENFISNALKEGKLLPIDLECSNSDNDSDKKSNDKDKQNEPTTSEDKKSSTNIINVETKEKVSLLDKFKEDNITTTLILSNIEESDLKDYGINKAGSLIRWKRILNELGEQYKTK